MSAMSITITKREYRQLLKDSEMLNRLITGGVNNWEWYGVSLYPEDREPFDEHCEMIDREFADKYE